MYRDHLQAAELRHQQLLQRRAGEQPRPVFEHLYRVRLRRTWAALAALGAIPLIFVASARPMQLIGPLFCDPSLSPEGLCPTAEVQSILVPLCFASSWLLAGLGALAAHLVAPRLFARALRRRSAPEGELFRDLSALDHQGPDSIAHQVVEQRRVLSLALPLVAVALLAPLSLHLVLIALLGGLHQLSGFGSYMLISVVVVGHAHLALAALGIRHARRCYRSLADNPDSVPRARGWEALGCTIAVACVPGLAIFGIPPLLVALTGAAFVPAMFGWAADRAHWENQLLRDAEQTIAPANR